MQWKIPKSINCSKACLHYESQSKRFIFMKVTVFKKKKKFEQQFPGATFSLTNGSSATQEKDVSNVTEVGQIKEEKA